MTLLDGILIFGTFSSGICGAFLLALSAGDETPKGQRMMRIGMVMYCSAALCGIAGLIYSWMRP